MHGPGSELPRSGREAARLETGSALQVPAPASRRHRDRHCRETDGRWEPNRPTDFCKVVRWAKPSPVVSRGGSPSLLSSVSYRRKHTAHKNWRRGARGSIFLFLLFIACPFPRSFFLLAILSCSVLSRLSPATFSLPSHNRQTDCHPAPCCHCRRHQRTRSTRRPIAPRTGPFYPSHFRRLSRRDKPNIVANPQTEDRGHLPTLF